jgi:hypothetical protein
LHYRIRADVAAPISFARTAKLGYALLALLLATVMVFRSGASRARPTISGHAYVEATEIALAER